MKKIFWLITILLLLAPRAALAENLIDNPDFEAVSGGLPVGWAADMWLTDEGVSELTAVVDAYEGVYSAKVRNLSANDARFSQTVRVEPGALYRIACRVKAQGVGLGKDGAGISIQDTFASSELLYDTRGEWVPVELYGVTGDSQTHLTVMARLGGYGSINTGTAWFDSFVMERVDEVPANIDVYSFESLSDQDGGAAADDFEDVDFDGEGASRGGPYTALLIAVGLLSALVMGVSAWLVGRRGALESASDGALRRALWMAIFVGFAVRAVLAVVVRGYPNDISSFEGWSARMAATGPAGFYAAEAFCDYPPGYMYVLWVVGALRNLLNLGFGRLNWLLVKLPAILFDLAAALLIYREARKPLGERAAVVMGILYALMPAAIFNSAAWGQIDAVLALLVALSLLNLSKGRYERSLVIFGLAILVKPQALLFAPLGLMVLVVEVFRADDRRRTALRLVRALGLMLAVMLLLALPFLTALPENLVARSDFAAGAPGFLKPVAWLISLYGGTMESYNSLTVNAANLYALLDKNWAPLEGEPVLKIFSIAMMALSYVYAAFLYARGKRRGRLMLVCATLLTLIFSFGPMMHERYLFPALLLLALSYAVDRDYRLLIAMMIIGLTQFLNAGLVLQSRHLLDQEQAINAWVSALNLAAAALMAWTAWDICVRDRVLSMTRRYRPERQRQPLPDPMLDPAAEGLFRPREWKLGMKRRDWLLMLGLTLVYAVVALTNLGALEAPESRWQSTADGEQVTFDLGSLRSFHMTYYGGICDTAFTVQLSEDGEVWSERRWAKYDQGEIFRWLWYEPGQLDESGEYAKLEEGYPVQTARFVRIQAERAGLILHEVAFIDEDGAPYPIASVYATGANPERAGDPKRLIDEQHTVPPYPSYFNGTYFDEIYHARTAYEHREGLHAYEYTHPPLGKVLIMVGINLFGMTPFGWRFMGALFGILMIPAMYMLARQLLRRSSPAFLAAFLMAVDAMHFTQTRIATIDVFAVFFIMVAYLFMLRYIMMSFHHARLWRTLVPLFFSGLFIGLAIASKWIGIYAAAGLALLFFYSVFLRAREYLFAKRNLKILDGEQRRVAQRAVKQFWRNLTVTLLWCVVFFIVIPLLIYYFSYYWQLTPDGAFTPRGVWNVQKSMFSYHAGLGDDDHWFKSKWYEWPLIVKPMWYYSGNAFMPEGWISSISCMGNPAVWWGGLLALIFVAGRLAGITFGGASSRLISPGGRADRRLLFVLVGFLSQYLPWTLIERSTFIYHYFASVPFIILAAAVFFEWLRRTRPGVYARAVWLYGAAALLLFVAFYPLMSGTPCPRAYANLLRWFGWYNF